VIARSDQGRLPIRTERVDVRELMEGARRRFGRRAAGAEVDLRVDAPDGLRAELDTLRVEQALGNLVDNALRYGGGPIDLVARDGAGGLRLAVRDHGPGFPPGFLEHAFERFTRADTGRSGGGAGLGLAIVQAIASAHGGMAEARNVQGAGAEVVLVLGPTHPPPRAPAPAPR
jgi:two-component system OmpR family sensor kinase